MNGGVLLATVICGAFAFGGGAQDPGENPFAPWDGRWRGTFTAYQADGKPLYEIQVNQEYRTVKPLTQSGVFTNRYADGRTETVHAVNLVEDGKLICRVRTVDKNGKASGSVKEHVGRRVGAGHIVWYADLGDGKFESFSERVDGDRYVIFGVGVYGEKATDRHIFEATYNRQIKPALGDQP